MSLIWDMERKREYVTHRGIRMPLYPWKHPSGARYWRVAYHDGTSWKYLTRSTKAAAKDAAIVKAGEISKGRVDLGSLSIEQERLVRAFLDLDPTWDDLESLRRSQAQYGGTLVDTIAAFYSWKAQEAGRESKHLKLTRTDLLSLAEFVGPDTPIDRIQAGEIAEWLLSLDVGPKRRKDYRAAAVMLWRWAAKQDRIRIHGVATEPEKTPVPKVVGSEVRIFTPEEMRFLLKTCPRDYLPWLAICAFSGVRTGEVRSWHKPPLEWKHIKRDVIEVPASISKNRRRRLAPVIPSLSCVLDAFAGAKGPIIAEPAWNSVTRLLGASMDKRFKRSEGWPSNALRHSYGSYRVAITQDVAATAHEMDNSETIIRRHYLEAVEKRDAEAYFALTSKNRIGTKS